MALKISRIHFIREILTYILAMMKFQRRYRASSHSICIISHPIRPIRATRQLSYSFFSLNYQLRLSTHALGFTSPEVITLNASRERLFPDEAMA